MSSHLYIWDLKWQKTAILKHHCRIDATSLGVVSVLTAKHWWLLSCLFQRVSNSIDHWLLQQCHTAANHGCSLIRWSRSSTALTRKCLPWLRRTRFTMRPDNLRLMQSATSENWDGPSWVTPSEWIQVDYSGVSPQNYPLKSLPSKLARCSGTLRLDPSIKQCEQPEIEEGGNNLEKKESVPSEPASLMGSSSDQVPVPHHTAHFF